MLVDRFMELFQGLERAYGTFKETSKSNTNKQKGMAITERELLTKELWQGHLSGEKGIGVVPIKDNACCHWGAIDIDVYDDFDHNELEERIKKLKLPLVIFRSKSGGAHLYIFMKEETDAKLIREKLIEWAAALGYSGIEIFPKQIKLADKHDIGNWINMPYFGGVESNRYCIVNGEKLNPEDFIKYIFKNNIRVEEKELKKIKLQLENGMEQAPPCLQFLCQAGFPDGSMNNSLFNMGVYAKKAFPDSWEEKIDDYNQEYMAPGSSKEVQNIIKQLDKKTFFYKCNDLPLSDFCNKSLCVTRKFGIGDDDSDPDIVVGVFTKVLSEPPTWIVDIHGVRVYMETTDFISQEKFRMKCVEMINRFPKRVNGKAWQKLIDDRVRNCEEIDAPEDAGPRGQFLFQLKQFCTSKYSQGKDKEDLLRGKVWINEEKIYFRSADLFKFLKMNRFVSLTERNVWAILHQMGGHHQFGIKGENVQCWWVNEFESQSEEFDVPDVTQEQESEVF